MRGGRLRHLNAQVPRDMTGWPWGWCCFQGHGTCQGGLGYPEACARVSRSRKCSLGSFRTQGEAGVTHGGIRAARSTFALISSPLASPGKGGQVAIVGCITGKLWHLGSALCPQSVPFWKAPELCRTNTGPPPHQRATPTFPTPLSPERPFRNDSNSQVSLAWHFP